MGGTYCDAHMRLCVLARLSVRLLTRYLQKYLTNQLHFCRQPSLQPRYELIGFCKLRSEVKGEVRYVCMCVGRGGGSKILAQ